MSLWRFVWLASFAGIAIAATPADWRSRSIYFMLTDRFARTDNSTTAVCDAGKAVGFSSKLREAENCGSFVP